MKQRYRITSERRIDRDETDRHDRAHALRLAGTVACLASGAAFGAMGIFGKLAYGEGATVGTLLSVRFAVAAALFWALLLARGGIRRARALPRPHLAAALALGAVGYALQAGCYFAALTRIDASLLALVLYTFPALVAGASVALGRERWTPAASPRSGSPSAASRSSWPARGRARSTRSAPRSASARRSSTAATSSPARRSPRASPGRC